jgi:hypothetical protein
MNTCRTERTFLCTMLPDVWPHKTFHRSAMMLSMKGKVAVVRTLKQARAYILKVGICGIFSDAGIGMPNFWEVVDLTDRQPGEKGWGQKAKPARRRAFVTEKTPKRKRELVFIPMAIPAWADHSSSPRATPLSFSRARYSSTRSRLPSPAR